MPVRTRNNNPRVIRGGSLTTPTCARTNVLCNGLLATYPNAGGHIAAKNQNNPLGSTKIGGGSYYDAVREPLRALNTLQIHRRYPLDGNAIRFPLAFLVDALPRPVREGRVVVVEPSEEVSLLRTWSDDEDGVDGDENPSLDGDNREGVDMGEALENVSKHNSRKKDIGDRIRRSGEYVVGIIDAGKSRAPKNRWVAIILHLTKSEGSTHFDSVTDFAIVDPVVVVDDQLPLQTRRQILRGLRSFCKMADIDIGIESATERSVWVPAMRREDQSFESGLRAFALVRTLLQRVTDSYIAEAAGLEDGAGGFDPETFFAPTSGWLDVDAVRYEMIGMALAQANRAVDWQCRAALEPVMDVRAHPPRDDEDEDEGETQALFNQVAAAMLAPEEGKNKRIFLPGKYHENGEAVVINVDISDNAESDGGDGNIETQENSTVAESASSGEEATGLVAEEGAVDIDSRAPEASGDLSQDPDVTMESEDSHAELYWHIERQGPSDAPSPSSAGAANSSRTGSIAGAGHKLERDDGELEDAAVGEIIEHHDQQDATGDSEPVDEEEAADNSEEPKVQDLPTPARAPQTKSSPGREKRAIRQMSYASLPDYSDYSSDDDEDPEAHPNTGAAEAADIDQLLMEEAQAVRTSNVVGDDREIPETQLYDYDEGIRETQVKVSDYDSIDEDEDSVMEEEAFGYQEEPGHLQFPVPEAIMEVNLEADSCASTTVAAKNRRLRNLNTEMRYETHVPPGTRFGPRTPTYSQIVDFAAVTPDSGAEELGPDGLWVAGPLMTSPEQVSDLMMYKHWQRPPAEGEQSIITQMRDAAQRALAWMPGQRGVGGNNRAEHQAPKLKRVYEEEEEEGGQQVKRPRLG